jgi:hypothetical protein
MFEKLGKERSETQCSAIDGTIKEADEVAGEIDDKAVLDAAIVANAQAVEHYAMFRYGTLIAWAEELGYDEIVQFQTCTGKRWPTPSQYHSAPQARQREGVSTAADVGRRSSLSGFVGPRSRCLFVRPGLSGLIASFAARTMPSSR